MGRLALMVCMLLSLTGCTRDAVETPVLGPIEKSKIDTIVGEHDEWQAGTHYEIVQPPSGMIEPAGKVTVVEFFWYGCPHCYTLEPHVVLWNRRKPANVELNRVPTTWGQYDRPHARLFYTLETLGRGDLHAEIFDTIHAQGNRLAASDEQETLRLQVEFAKQHGIDAQRFVDAYNSDAVAERLRSAEQLLAHYRVDKLPTLVVHGKYKTDVTRTGRSGEALMRLIGDLAAHEQINQ
ncbi:MAG: thiol:disulfide interchange protein DsbA/DsbL [Steroidobacter sp.]